MTKSSPKPRRPHRSKRRHKTVGNQQDRLPESTAGLIERIMAEPIETKLNGKTVSLTVFEAIVYQLIQKCAAGNVQAGAALLQLEDMGTKIVDHRPIVEFVEREAGDTGTAIAPEHNDG